MEFEEQLNDLIDAVLTEGTNTRDEVISALEIALMTQREQVAAVDLDDPTDA